MGQPCHSKLISCAWSPRSVGLRPGHYSVITFANTSSSWIELWSFLPPPSLFWILTAENIQCTTSRTGFCTSHYFASTKHRNWKPRWIQARVFVTSPQNDQATRGPWTMASQLWSPSSTTRWQNSVLTAEADRQYFCSELKLGDGHFSEHSIPATQGVTAHWFWHKVWLSHLPSTRLCTFTRSTVRLAGICWWSACFDIMVSQYCAHRINLFSPGTDLVDFHKK